MTDKRRRARVQGGWASGGPSAHSQNHSSSGQDYQKRNGLNSSSLVAHQQAGVQHGAPYTSQESKFVFCSNKEQEQKKAPDDILIRRNGYHELSRSNNGISSIYFQDNFIPEDEQGWLLDQLLKECPWKQEQIVIKGKKVEQPRLTAWFGSESYAYSGLTLKPYQFSPTLLVLRERVEAFAGHTFNSVLANLYRDCKDSIDWHSDDEGSLGTNPVIASLSLGDTRTFEMRRKPDSGRGEDYKHTQTIRIPLCSGSLLVMQGATQSDWQHRVPKEYHDRRERINLTFRTIISGGDI